MAPSSSRPPVPEHPPSPARAVCFAFLLRLWQAGGDQTQTWHASPENPHRVCETTVFVRSMAPKTPRKMGMRCALMGLVHKLTAGKGWGLAAWSNCRTSCGS